MTLVEGPEELQNLWTLVQELSTQLSANQQLCNRLQAQADELKGQAIHSGTGYTLRRFNLDISKEKFESELEKINSQLVIENQSLAHENKQISILLREYESTLETIMAKFRSFSHSTQQHTLALTSHYESLLTNNAYEVANADLRANTAFSEHLTHLGSLVRLALREFEGESIEDQQDEQNHDEDPFEAEGYHVGSPSGVEPKRAIPTMISNPKTVRQQKKAKQPYGSASGGDPRWYGTGGYTGFQGDPDAEVANIALESRIEEERLRAENEMLRELLRVSADLTPEVAQAVGIDMPPPPTGGWQNLNGAKLSLGKPRGSRKSIGEQSSGALGTSEDKVAEIQQNENQRTGNEENAENSNQSDSDLFPPSPAGVHTFATSGLDNSLNGGESSHNTSIKDRTSPLNESTDGSDIGLSMSNESTLIQPGEVESNEEEQSTSSTALGLQSMTAASSATNEIDLQDLAKNTIKESDTGDSQSSAAQSSTKEDLQSTRAETLLQEIDSKLVEAASDLKETKTDIEQSSEVQDDKEKTA